MGFPAPAQYGDFPWFKALWLQKQTEWATQVKPRTKGHSCFLGDSITQGWGDVGSSFPEASRWPIEE